MKEHDEDELRNIQRMTYTYKTRLPSFGWWVRVMRGNKKYSKYFSDKKYGGEEKALEEAKRYRDKLEREKDKESLVGLGYHTFFTNRNKSGVVGIHRAPSTTRRPSGRSYTYDFWTASWLDPVTGKRKTRRFSISKHGEAGALKLALKAREEAIALISGEKVSFVSEWGQSSLTSLVKIIETSESANEKGRALEELAYILFGDIPGFSINGTRVRTETEEIDLMLLNNSDDPRFKKESAILLVECKNWSTKCGKNEFVLFKEKIENRSNRCTLGFLISWNGFAETVTKEMLRGSREQTLVIPIDGDEIKQAIQDKSFEKLLTDSFDKAVSI